MEKCKNLMRRCFLPIEKSQNESVNEKHQENRSQEGQAANVSSEEADSIWLYEVLSAAGVHDVYRKTLQQAGILREIQLTFNYPHTQYGFGSTCEGTITPEMLNDLDVMQCDETFPVIENISKAKKNVFSLLLIREIDTPAGYVKLQVVMRGIPCTYIHWPVVTDFWNRRILRIDKSERIILVDLFGESGRENHFSSRAKNKPALKTENYYGYYVDHVTSYRCKTWPTMAQEWLSRRRLFGWPTQDMIKELKSLGFFVVRKGHPLSSDKDLEWRISLSLQERKLVFSFIDVQHKCYVVLKMINRDILGMDCISSYHWKTCIFHVIENNDGVVWRKELLFHCTKLCIKKMLTWVKFGFCPEYFIPGENLFDGRLNDGCRLILENILEKLLIVGYDCLLFVRTNNICDYIRSRGSKGWYQLLKQNSKRDYTIDLYCRRRAIISDSIATFNERILGYYYYLPDKDIRQFIKSLWITLYRIEHIETITEHTTEDTRCALSLLIPYIYTCLASNISAMAIRHPNAQVRNFLLLGSFLYFIKGDASGRLKLISVLYAVGLYNECAWFLDQEAKEFIKYRPSICSCRYIVKDYMIANFSSMKYSNLKLSTCVTFLPTELPITTDALKFEMFRSIGVPLNETDKTHKSFLWHYRAVVDSHVYYYLLKCLIERRLKGKSTRHAKYFRMIYNLLSGPNVRHLDVAYNLTSWISYTSGLRSIALIDLHRSWKAMKSFDTCFMIFTEDMKKKQYQFNAAMLHALVILYNTWFVGNESNIQECFQCFIFSLGDFKTCSRCKIATYCSRKCQRKNWKLHKVVCEIARRYHHI